MLAVKANDQAIVLSCQKGMQVLNAADGKTLWERAASPDGFDVGGDRAVALAAEDGAKSWATFDLKSGRPIARQAVAADTLWHPPVLVGQTVLVSDSLGGEVTGFDAVSGRRRFELALDMPLAGPPVTAADKVLLHTLRAGVIHVTIVDPAHARVGRRCCSRPAGTRSAAWACRH